MSDETVEDDLRSALAGDEPALNRLVHALTPVIQSRVACAVLRWRTGTAAGRDIRPEVEDLTRDVFLFLFADNGKVLRSWQPELGMSLLDFVGFVAKRQTLSILRSRKRSPWNEM